MRYILMLSVIALPAIFLVVGCGGGSSQDEQEHHAHHSSSAQLELHPEGDPGVSGTASFKDTSDGVVVKLILRNLPKPNTFYLAHIHPGTCTEGEGEGEEAHEHGEHAGEGEGHEHEGYSHEHGEEEIEYPLSQVKSNSEGQGSSTTTLRETSVEKLFSGEPKKHVNVHEAGSGNPPILTCADLKRAG